MPRSRTDQILEDWDMITHNARPPSSAPRPSFLRRAMPATLAAAAALLIVALAAAGIWISRPGPAAFVGGSPTPSSTSIATATSNPTPGATSSPLPSSTTSPEPTDALGSFTCAYPVNRGGSASGPSQAQANSVRVGTHNGYDRIVFEYSGPVTPTVRIETASPPFSHDPSGLPMTVAGTSYLKIVLTGVAIGYSGPTDFPVAYPVLTDLQRAGDYEAVQSWIVGLSKATCVRIIVLTSPTRLVIDLQG